MGAIIEQWIGYIENAANVDDADIDADSAWCEVDNFTGLVLDDYLEYPE